MDFLVNDLSMHGQFHDLNAFRSAVGRLMEIRQRILQHGYTLSCHRNLLSSQVTASANMQQAVASMPMSSRRAWMQWVTRQGPFWEDARLHGGDDWLEVDGDVVTDSAVGEAAIGVSRGLARELVSFEPSGWLKTPVPVRWVRDNGPAEDIDVANRWTLDPVVETLAAHPKPVSSWADLEARTAQECSRLTFAENAFQHLRGQPFSPGAADRIRILLRTLHRMKGCFDEKGSRTPEGQQLYQDHFTGDKAWFTDSSDTEKRDFKDALTFRHPGDATKELFCTWHGKVKTPQYRVHFSSPIAADVPLYVVFVGPKITKR